MADDSSGGEQLDLDPSVFVCVSAGFAVFLDLKKDKYLGLDPLQTRVLLDAVRGWPRIGPQPPPTLGEASVAYRRELLDELIAAGLLVRSGHGKSAEAATIQSPTSTLINSRLTPLARPTPVQILRFVASLMCAWSYTRWFSLHSAIEALRRRKNRQSRVASPIELQRAFDEFRYMRPLFYSSETQCLFDSIALTLFLSYQGLHATLVIGVKGAPFAAHCWVQSEDIALNGTPTYIGRYVPILTI